MTSEPTLSWIAPGRPCGYNMGDDTLRPTEKVMVSRRPAFDVAAFNDAVVETRGVPAPVVSMGVHVCIVRRVDLTINWSRLLH